MQQHPSMWNHLSARTVHEAPYVQPFPSREMDYSAGGCHSAAMSYYSFYILLYNGKPPGRHDRSRVCGQVQPSPNSFMIVFCLPAWHGIVKLHLEDIDTVGGHHNTIDVHFGQNERICSMQPTSKAAWCGINRT